MEPRKEHILQLRQYNINKGRNKTDEPIYPITTTDGIIDAKTGKKVDFSTIGSSSKSEVSFNADNIKFTNEVPFPLELSSALSGLKEGDFIQADLFNYYTAEEQEELVLLESDQGIITLYNPEDDFFYTLHDYEDQNNSDIRYIGIIQKFQPDSDAVYRQDIEGGGTIWFTMEKTVNEFDEVNLEIYPLYVKRIVKRYSPGTYSITVNPTVYCINPAIGGLGGAQVGMGHINIGGDFAIRAQSYTRDRYIPIVGRFQSLQDNPTINFEDAFCYIPDSSVEIKADHTYEYNIFDGVCNIIDVTTSNS